MNELQKLLENAGVQLNEGQEWHVEDANGDSYSVYITDANNTDEMFVEVNGVSVAHAVLGGGGIMDTSIQKPKGLMEALFAFANNNAR